MNPVGETPYILWLRSVAFLALWRLGGWLCARPASPSASGPRTHVAGAILGLRKRVMWSHFSGRPRDLDAHVVVALFVARARQHAVPVHGIYGGWTSTALWWFGWCLCARLASPSASAPSRMGPCAHVADATLGLRKRVMWSRFPGRPRGFWIAVYVKYMFMVLSGVVGTCGLGETAAATVSIHNGGRILNCIWVRWRLSGLMFRMVRVLPTLLRAGKGDSHDGRAFCPRGLRGAILASGRTKSAKVTPAALR